MSHFKAKMHQVRFWLWLCPNPTEGVFSAPKPLSGFKEPCFYGEGGTRVERMRAFPHLVIYKLTTGRQRLGLCSWKLCTTDG